MAIPFTYNLRSLRARWTSTVVAILGIAGTVGVFVAMLSLARGFEATLMASGSARNALVATPACSIRSTSDPKTYSSRSQCA